jgi:hypothetical protein
MGKNIYNKIAGGIILFFTMLLCATAIVIKYGIMGYIYVMLVGLLLFLLTFALSLIMEKK